MAKWLTQWGSKALGDQGILRRKSSAIITEMIFTSIPLKKFQAFRLHGQGIPFPRVLLVQKVRQMQEQLNVIAGAYPAIPKITVDGIYGPATASSVRKFQSVFGLPVTGTVDYRTWYKISEIYVGVSRIAELS